MAIHVTAVVDPSARIHDDAHIGPYCVIGAEVEIGPRTRLLGHVFVEGPIRIGEDNTFYPYSTIGVAPQDLKYKGERSEARIGNRNRIREFVTIHRGTEGGGMVTAIGSDNLLMAYVHVAHDVQVGDHAILSHGCTLGGHVIIGDWAVIGAHSGVHQFCRVGRHAMVGGYSVVTQDIIEPLQTALRLLTRSGLNTSQAIERIRSEVPRTPEVQELLAFIESSDRGVVKG
jgi:UDP-N-acetylglucosamine acyltransferase